MPCAFDPKQWSPIPNDEPRQKEMAAKSEIDQTSKQSTYKQRFYYLPNIHYSFKSSTFCQKKETKRTTAAHARKRSKIFLPSYDSPPQLFGHCVSGFQRSRGCIFVLLCPSDEIHHTLPDRSPNERFVYLGMFSRSIHIPVRLF